MAAPLSAPGQSDAIRELVVSRREEVSSGVIALSLASADGAALPPWTPGAHLDVILPNGMVRQYSLCGDPDDHTEWRIAVLRETAGRGGSAWIHDFVRAGDRLSVRGPRNHFPLEPARRYLFIAGGIGITPMLPMVQVADQAGTDWTLLYGGRARSSMAFLEELDRYGDRVRVEPQDEVGLIDLPAVLGEPCENTLVYCCGPEPLLLAVTEMCRSWDADVVRLERFASGEPVDAVHASDASIVIELRRSGVTVVVPPDRSILEVVNEAGANVMSSCEEGICGTCETVVVEGVPDHRDQVLTASERRSGASMMLCVSRACGERLVLDI